VCGRMCVYVCVCACVCACVGEGNNAGRSMMGLVMPNLAVHCVGPSLVRYT